jgi:hypothetical protein
MKARISRISLIVCGVLLTFSFFVLSVPGAYWPWYSLTGIVAVVPVVIGPRSYRWLGVFALAISVLLVASDVKAGRTYQEKMQRFWKQAPQSTTNAQPSAKAGF